MVISDEYIVTFQKKKLMNNGPILIVDDDNDDWELLQEAWKELPFENQLIFCSSGNEVLEYLYSHETKRFLILSDVNLPKMDGFELKAKLLEDDPMNYKSIPFVFWSSPVTRSQIEKATIWE
jgi:CheY-like chemotaxis protein